MGGGPRVDHSVPFTCCTWKSLNTCHPGLKYMFVLVGGTCAFCASYMGYTLLRHPDIRINKMKEVFYGPMSWKGSNLWGVCARVNAKNREEHEKRLKEFYRAGKYEM